MVHEYEEREAASFALIPWRDWCKQERGERAAGIAHFRLHRLIEAHVSDAVTTAMKRRNRQAANG